MSFENNNNKIKAFIAHSFAEEDKILIDKFLDYFDSFKNILTWEHAKDPLPRAVSDKVKKLMESKDLFIGIFTKKYPLGMFRKKWLPSLWIVQESGYAIGKNMRLLLLVEDVINKNDIEGLQGDYELIFFSRKNPELSFGKINHMIHDIYKCLVKKEKIIPIEQKEQLREERKTDLDLFDELIKAIENKNVEKEEEVYKQLTAGKSPEEVEEWESLRLAIRARHKDKKSFEELKKKATEQKKFYPNLNLGRYYKYVLKDNKQAQIYFKNAYEYTESFDRKIQALEELSKSLSKLGKVNESYEVIISFLNEKRNSLKENEMAEIYKILSEVAKLNKDDNLFLNFAEKSLEINPHDSDLRFSLAYKYSELGEDELALHHYKILSQMNPSGAVCNNLGVTYENLGMHSLSVTFYKKAMNEYNNTLATANLAYKYIDKGFLAEAEEILKKAKQYENYHPNVDSAFQKLQKVREGEKDKEEEILDNIKEENEFRKEFTSLFIQSIDEKFIEGKWESPYYGEIVLSADGFRIEGEGKIPEHSSLTHILFSSKPSKKVKKLILNGEIRGATAKYAIKIYKGEPGHFLFEEEGYDGLMLFYPDKNEIKVLEWDKNKKRRIYNMKKKSEL